jgi:hypothetical protein
MPSHGDDLGSLCADARGATPYATRWVQTHRTRGIRLIIGDAAGSIAALWVASETRLDEYQLARIPFRAGDVIIGIGEHVGVFALYAAKRHPEVACSRSSPTR